MRLSITRAIGVLLLTVFATTLALAEEARAADDRTQKERSYEGKPLSYWLQAIRNRDEEKMALALDAIRYFGPDAWAAVPQLTGLVAAPFVAIRLQKDSDEEIAAKLYDIEVRSAAIDALASIGETAAVSTIPIIQWALTMRVIADEETTREDDRFVDLVTLEVEYRIKVMRAVQQLGDPAMQMTARLLKSPDPEKRKFAVLILGSDVLPIASDLLKSRDCEDQQLGLTILHDIEPLAAKAYVSRLARNVVCDSN